MMEMTRKHLLCLAVLTALSPVLITQSHAQLHLEITKAPEEAPKIAIVPFSNDQNLYPIIENDLNRSGKFTSSSKNLPATAAMNTPNAEAWQAAGVPYVVTGSMKPAADGSFEVHYQLYDVQKKHSRRFQRTHCLCAAQSCNA